MTTLKDYADWMKALRVFVPDGSYETKALALDEERNSVHVMDFEDGKIKHMTKIWNAGWAMKELGWA